jgi:hypothetical protein
LAKFACPDMVPRTGKFLAAQGLLGFEKRAAGH